MTTTRRARRARVWERKHRRKLRAMRRQYAPGTFLYVMAYRPRYNGGPVRHNWRWLHERVAHTIIVGPEDA